HPLGMVNAQRRIRARPSDSPSSKQLPPLREWAMSHAFTLQVTGIDTTGNYEDRLYNAGCSDAMVAVLGGSLYLDFDREAPTFEAAVQSARRDVERAGGHVDR